MGYLAGERSSPVYLLRTLRWSSLVLGFCNAIIFPSGIVIVVSLPPGCSGSQVLAFTVVSLVAAVRITYMVSAGKAQRATAETIVNNVLRSSVDADALVRHERRRRYKRWLWWTRFGMMITALQFLVALYLLCVFAKGFSSGDDGNNGCLKGLNNGGWKKILTVSFLVLVWFVVIIQCSTGSDVLRWRSFYATHDTAWKAHYREVFDHGIREVLCCLGRVKYLSVLEEDEVYSVARLLGDLVAYRASGTGHLELLAGLALLQKHKHSSVYANLVEAPDVRLQEAAVFHKFAEAAYTGPLLDFGRNPILFPCAWLYRQGVLSPWARNRRPTLEGDNWWRGHAAAFLRYVSLPPEAIRRGRVSQTRRQAAYFVIVIHDLKSIVIAVRGTETPEDLITDGLCRDCALSMDDLDGIVNSNQIPQTVKEGVISSFPHYGHSGIVEYARELFMQIDGQPADNDGVQSNKSGFLSSLMGIGCECYGYRICIVGHSLGGAVATLLGMRLFARYPNLHVYSYGALPCVDLVVAEACSDFVTCIVYNDEFSSRLSMNSILRLRAAAVCAISNDSSTNPAMVTKIVQNILHTKTIKENKKDCNALSPSPQQGTETTEDGPQTFAAGSGQPDQQLYHDGAYLFDMASSKSPQGDFNAFGQSQLSGAVPFENTKYLFHIDEAKSACVDNTLQSIQALGEKSTEVYVAGLIIHIILVRRSTSATWRKWIANDNSEYDYKAFVTNRENFMDIVVSPYMFLDHLPWRCHYAIQKTLESRKCSGKIADNVFNKEDIV